MKRRSPDVSKSTILRAIKSHRISAGQTETVKSHAWPRFAAARGSYVGKKDGILLSG
jgi:hypothetical protein